MLRSTSPRQTRRAARLAVLACTLGTLSAALGADPEIRFLKPRNLATVVGETIIEVRVVVPPGATVDRIEFLIDGRRAAERTAPPWTVVWDAGEADQGHRLEAVLFLTDGRQARAGIRVSPLQVQDVVRVDLVNLYLVVRDDGGDYVTNLEREDFAVREDGIPQSLERFSASHKPLRVGIVLDSSLSMTKGDRLKKAKKAAMGFLDVLREDDQGIVVSFNDYVRLGEELSSDTEALARSIEVAEASGGTALYDAVWKTSKLLADFDGRRVMVLLSDGRDESANGFEPGSLHTVEEALDEALRAEVMIFPIGLGDDLEDQFIHRWSNLSGRSNVDDSTSLAELLERLADTTGGRAVMSDNAAKLRRAFAEIAADLRHQYSIAYTSTNPKQDGKWRSVEVETPERRLEVVTRKGYYAPRSERDR